MDNHEHRRHAGGGLENPLAQLDPRHDLHERRQRVAGVQRRAHVVGVELAGGDGDHHEVDLLYCGESGDLRAAGVLVEPEVALRDGRLEGREDGSAVVEACRPACTRDEAEKHESSRGQRKAT